MQKTIFCDIDGTLFQHWNEGLSTQLEDTAVLIPGARKMLDKWQAAGHMIILTTGRRESQRKMTEEQLARNNLYFDKLIMGLPRGTRLVVNDHKAGQLPRAQAVSVLRNSNLISVDTDDCKRPWGEYQTLYEEAAVCKTKLVMVEPGQAPSYQVHKLRDEHWIIISGTGAVRVDNITHEVVAGDHVYVARNIPHSIKCTSTDQLRFIEVQTGDYFGEDDIERLSDVYGRD